MYFPKGVFMKFLRNPEIKKCLFLQLLVCFIFAGIVFYFDTICVVIILFASLIFILIFIIFKSLILFHKASGQLGKLIL